MRVVLLVLALMILAPAGQSVGEELDEPLIPENSEILQTYSKSVQYAFERVSSLDRYEDNELSRAGSWLVVTGINYDKHHLTKASPDKSEPVKHLKGSFIWNFDNTESALSSLKDSYIAGEIESFSPLIEKRASTKSIPNDPLFGDQWHLNNSGQTGGETGEDANVTGVWNSYNGSGVVISVIDDGVDHDHPDLNPNYLSSYSYDWCGDDPDPEPTSSQPHGTAVAGVAAGVGNNDLDIVGAAFGAGIAGHKLIACGFSGSTEASALSYSNDNIDIYSNSWGPSDSGDVLSGPGPITIAAIENSVYNGRSGLGNIYTWAAGNGLTSEDNSNKDGYASLRHTIAVSAISHYGEQSYYSEPGANILVTAHSNGGSPNFEGITTTDIVGSGGYDSGNVTHTFGGTSSATPLASGVIALMLQANSNLTWRDVQNILVQSSRKNDASDSSWNLNGAGLEVSHKYGFGAVDAGAAVGLAENWTSSGAEINASFGPFLPGTDIDDGSGIWSEFNLSVPLDIALESIDVFVDIDHTSRGNLDIVLESPSGHESWLAEKHSDSNDDYDDWMFGTVQHWGESSQGIWKLKIRDTVNGDSGTLNSWEVVFHGVGNVSDFDGDGWPDYNDEDDDNDGWTDTDELSCLTDQYNSSSFPSDTDNDGQCDYLDEDDDGDGFTDSIEFSCQTDPLNSSSNPSDTDNDGQCDYLDEDDDGDGFTDSIEFSCQTDPLNSSSNPSDTDNDGQCDYLDEDDDGDGLSDGNETGLYRTDPLDPDTDDDNLTDYEEVITHGTSPLSTDTDLDGLSDYEEVITLGTNPQSADSDSDGLSDLDELEVWSSDPLTFDPDNDSDTYYHFMDCDDNDPGANPSMEELLNGKDDDCDGISDEGFNESDQDDDGLSDWSEFHTYGTDLNNSDTDQDGLFDYEEIFEFGSDPLYIDLDADGDGAYWFDDCNDNDTSFAPGVSELLDGLDNDCDELVDEDFFWIDSDGDTLTDYVEYYTYFTDPNNGDSDGDGLPDGAEIYDYLSDPLIADPDNDSDSFYHFEDCDDNDFERSPGTPERLDGKDNDCDGELDEGFDIIDSDGDGLSDYDEYHNYSTNPDSSDTDGDGLSDFDEISSGTSSPYFPDYDSDMDGYYDFEDCDDKVASTNPGASEMWNGVDDDCDGTVDELLDRLGLVGSSLGKSNGAVYYSVGQLFDGPRVFDQQPHIWDSANQSFKNSIFGILPDVEAEINWSLGGFSLDNNTSADRKSVMLSPIDCQNPLGSLQIQVCDEGISIQILTATIQEQGYYTEIEWEVLVSTWVEPEPDRGFISSISTPTWIIGSVVFLLGLAGGGFLMGTRLAEKKKLQDALDAYGVTPDRLAVVPAKRGIDLPSAPDLGWSRKED